MSKILALAALALLTACGGGGDDEWLARYSGGAA